MLARAAPYMPRELLRTAYIALARSHLEYASATFMSASSTQMKKLDTVQRKASRVICRVPRDTHSEPLLTALRLDSLEARRNAHAIQIVEAILSENTHPALTSMFTRDKDGRAENSNTARIQLGNRRFSSFAKNIYNGSIALPSLPRPPRPLDWDNWGTSVPYQLSVSEGLTDTHRRTSLDVNQEDRNYGRILHLQRVQFITALRDLLLTSGLDRFAVLAGDAEVLSCKK